MVRKQMRVDRIRRTIKTKVSTEIGLEDLGMVSDTRVRYTVMASKHVHHTVKENQQDHWNEEVDDEEGGSALQVQLEVDVFERSVPDPLGGRVVQNPFPVFCEVVQLDVVFNDEELEFTVSIVPWNHHNGTHLPVEWKVCDVNVT